MINDLRKKKLKLRPVTYLSGTQSSGSNIPYGYMWSPHLVPKPKGSVSYELTHECFSSFLIDRNFRFKLFNLFSDWRPQIDVVGFCFLDLASNYEPPAELVEWLEAGDKPIYIGFGSLVSFFVFFT